MAESENLFSWAMDVMLESRVYQFAFGKRFSYGSQGGLRLVVAGDAEKQEELQSYLLHALHSLETRFKPQTIVVTWEDAKLWRRLCVLRSGLSFFSMCWK